MEGNQFLRPQDRVFLIAAIFALVAIALLVLVLEWPRLMMTDRPAEATELSPEEREKLAILKQVGESSEEPPPPQEEKLRILRSLNIQ